MEKILPFNFNPTIKVLPQYAFLDGIIDNEYTNSSMICSVDILGLKTYEWNYVITGAEIQITHETISLFRKGYGTKLPGGWYCHANADMEMIFCITQQQYSNRWDSIVFFIDAHEEFSFTEEMNWSYKLILHCCGDVRIDVDEEMEFYKKNDDRQELPIWYKVKIEYNHIRIEVSRDGKSWNLLHDTCIKCLEGNHKIVKGFYVHQCDNHYFKWKCNNFIQIRYDQNLGDIGYSGLIIRDWKNYAIHPLIKFSYDKNKSILHRGLWNYIVDNINNNRYLEIWLNEFFLEGTNAFCKYYYNHESLIYGYNEESKKIKLLSVFDGKYKATEISIEILEVAWQKANESNSLIRLFEFSPDEQGYEIDLGYIRSQLCEYLAGINTSLKYKIFAEKESGVFGINIYDSILFNDDTKEKFLEDRRVAYLLKEHKECMRFRVMYLYEKGIISEKKYTNIIEKVEEIVKIAEIVLNLVLKNKVVDRKSTRESIWNHLRELKEKEVICYGDIIELLSNE